MIIGSIKWLMALGSSAFLRYNNRLDFCLFECTNSNFKNKQKNFKRLPIFFDLKNIVKRFDTT
ncbi:hypothetical protein EGK59_03395 [Acinetobacter soli]|nr:hypothetical protein EGK59_03395 [Acinetobacter soli]